MSFIMRTLVLGALAVSISGVAHAMAQPARHETAASSAIDSLVAGEAVPDLIPSEFSDDMGYTPVFESGTLRNPSGGCSTPGEVGPAMFNSACQTHDLGYDLLRYAEKEGRRLGPTARLDLDLRLYLDLLEICESAICSLTATAYFCAVSANSIRQGYKTPRSEPTDPWMALAAGILGLSAVGGLPSVKARFDPSRADGRGSP